MRDMMTVRFKQDVSKLDRLVDKVVRDTPVVVNEAADELILEIKENWSSTAPSSPFNEPAKVTGTLEASIAKIDARGSGGRFARREDVTQISVVVGAPYARALEYGYAPRNLQPRPYFWKAVRRVEERYGKLFSTIMRT